MYTYIHTYTYARAPRRAGSNRSPAVKARAWRLASQTRTGHYTDTTTTTTNNNDNNDNDINYNDYTHDNTHDTDDTNTCNTNVNTNNDVYNQHYSQ